MPTPANPSFALKTTPTFLVEWAKSPRAQKQPRTADALRALRPEDEASLRRAYEQMSAVVAAPVQFSVKFEGDPSAAMCLVVLDRALGGAPLPEVDALVDAAAREHEGDIIKLAGKLLDELHEFSSRLRRIHDAVPLSETEAYFSRRAVESAEFAMHDAFVSQCLDAADYLGEDLDESDEQLADRAFLAWLLQAFPTALPTFDTAERTRLLLALAEPLANADSKEVETYVRHVIDGRCVNALDYQVVRTRHVALLRTFVAEAPHGFGERARTLLAELEKHGFDRWGPGGRS